MTEFTNIIFSDDDDEPFRFSCSVIVEHQTPLLATPSLAQRVVDTMLAVFVGQDSQLWGYVVMPDAVHMVVEVGRERDYHVLVEAFKTRSEAVLIQEIQAHQTQLIDYIIRFNPAWNEAIYRVWQDGYHTQRLNTPYAVSNRVADLLTKPVEAGLVNTIGEWPFSNYQKSDTV